MVTPLNREGNNGSYKQISNELLVVNMDFAKQGRWTERGSKDEFVNLGVTGPTPAPANYLNQRFVKELSNEKRS